MPINDEFVSMLKRNMPNMTPQDVQLAKDYTAQIDSAVSHFTGSDTLEIGTMNANFGNWGQYPFEGARIMRDSTQAISNGTYTDVIFDTVSFESYQSGSILWDPAVSTTRLTVQVAGIYTMFGDVRFEQNGSNVREVWIYSNRTDDAGAGHIAMSSVGGTSGVGTTVTFGTTFEFNVGDWVTLRVWQNSGGSLNIDNARFNMYRIR